nr:MAG: hypothetical protein 2 [Sobelivirales sp.]
MIREAFGKMNGTAVPGTPYHFTYPRKSDWISKDLESLVDLVLERLTLLEYIAPSNLELHANTELIAYGFQDPVSIFVKGEPHKIEKIQQGRYRLIANCTLVEEAIKRLLFAEQNDADKADCYNESGSAGGWDWTTDEAASRCFRSLKSWLPTAATSDVSAWDWSVKEWMFMAELEIRRRLNGASKTSSWYKISYNVYKCFCRSVYILTDGTAYTLEHPGVQKSGDYNTTTTNGRIRNLMAVLVGSEKSKSAGDDNISTYVDDAVAKYAKYGLKVTDYKKVENGRVPFCSATFTEDKAIPDSAMKSLYNLLMSKPSYMLLDTFRNEFRHAPDIDKAEAGILSSGYLAELA